MYKRIIFKTTLIVMWHSSLSHTIISTIGLESARQCKVENLNIVLTELEDLIIGMGKLCEFEIDNHSEGRSNLNDRKKHVIVLQNIIAATRECYELVSCAKDCVNGLKDKVERLSEDRLVWEMTADNASCIDSGRKSQEIRMTDLRTLNFGSGRKVQEQNMIGCICSKRVIEGKLISEGNRRQNAKSGRW